MLEGTDPVISGRKTLKSSGHETVPSVVCCCGVTSVGKSVNRIIKKMKRNWKFDILELELGTGKMMRG